MKKHINADFFKLLIAFLMICASLKPGLSDASATNTDVSVICCNSNIVMSIVWSGIKENANNTSSESTTLVFQPFTTAYKRSL